MTSKKCSNLRVCHVRLTFPSFNSIVIYFVFNSQLKKKKIPQNIKCDIKNTRSFYLGNTINIGLFS